MKRLILMGICLLAVAALAVPAAGEDLNPPPWRGEWSTTTQVWEFLTPDPNPVPDPIPGAQPPLDGTYLTVTPLAGASWLEYDQGREGVWPLSGEIFVHVENHLPPNEVKMVWIQLTWRPQDLADPLGVPGLTGFNPDIAGDPLPMEDMSFADGWIHTTAYFEIRPNPDWEEFIIFGNINVDELVIDTWCIPEPATMMLLGGLAIPMLLRRRRR